MSSPPADVHARVELGATLADQDLARADLLAAEALDAEPLGVGITTVARAGRAPFRTMPCQSSEESVGVLVWGLPCRQTTATQWVSVDAGDLEDRQLRR